MNLIKKSLLGLCALALPATSALALSISQTGHGDAAYTAGKWALRGLGKSAAMEFVDDGIRVNTVCPGLVVTDLNRGGAHLKSVMDMTPMRRAGTPDPDGFRRAIRGSPGSA